jgi:antitoxin component YwqK of YwqJK toxin-antitoxin module
MKNKLFIPRKLFGEGSRWLEWNKLQPVVNGIQINQYDMDGRKQGYWEDYYVGSDDIFSKGAYLDGKMDGMWEWYWNDGSLWSKGNHINGVLDLSTFKSYEVIEKRIW